MNGLKNVRNRRDDSLARVRWDQLESLLAAYYRGQGYEVEHVGTGASGSKFDGGIDLKLRKNKQYILVQCNHWNAKQVPHNEVHQLLGIMINEGATGAILVSSGEFTAYAKESAAKQGHVQLIDGDGLRAMIGPLPEAVSTPTEGKGRGAPITSIVGERLLSAVESRIRGGRSPRSAYEPLIRLFVGLVMIAVIVMIFQSAFQRVETTMAASVASQKRQFERLSAQQGARHGLPTAQAPVPAIGFAAPLNAKNVPLPEPPLGTKCIAKQLFRKLPNGWEQVTDGSATTYCR